MHNTLDVWTDMPIHIRTDPICIVIINFVTKYFQYNFIWLSGNMSDIRPKKSHAYPVFGNKKYPAQPKYMNIWIDSLMD